MDNYILAQSYSLSTVNGNNTLSATAAVSPIQVELQYYTQSNINP